MEAYEAQKRTKLAVSDVLINTRKSTSEDIETLTKKLEEFQQSHSKEDEFLTYVDYLPTMDMAKTFAEKGYDFYFNFSTSSIIEAEETRLFVIISWDDAQPNRIGSIRIFDENGDRIYREAKTHWTWPWNKRK